MRYPIGIALLVAGILATSLRAQINPLWSESKIKNYLPYMTRPEVEDLLTRSDMAIIPVTSLEQHGLHLPIGSDFIGGVERAKLIAQRTDALVVPILFPGQSPYHMGFAGTVTLPAELVQAVYVEAVKSLIHHGFKRFLILNAHGGNRAITTFVVDRINQETSGIAVDLGAAAAPFMARPSAPQSTVFDRHGGVGETSSIMYLAPNLVDLTSAKTATLTMPEHMERMVPAVLAGDPTALTVFLAEGLKAEETGKHTSAREMSSTGVWGVRDLQESTAAQGEAATMRFVNAAVKFIERWKELRPMGR
ncbi:MAG: creatininase family protein [Gemmatimonadales bacterium]